MVPADFYVGKGETMEWIGSFAQGSPEHMDREILARRDEPRYRAAVAVLLQDKAGVKPDEGRAWSNAEYSYTFDAGRVWCRKQDKDWVMLPGDGGWRWEERLHKMLSDLSKT